METSLFPCLDKSLVLQARKSIIWKKVWLFSIKAVLETPDMRDQFATYIVIERNALYGVLASFQDPAFYSEIFATEQKMSQTRPLRFCPVWDTLFQNNSAHGLVSMMDKVGPIGEFATWGLRHHDRKSKDVNRAWVNRFVGDVREARRNRKRQNQSARGRVKGPDGGTHAPTPKDTL